MGNTDDRVHFLDSHEITCSGRFYHSEWSIALPGGADPVICNLQRGARANISGPRVGVSVAIGQLPIYRGELDRVVITEPFGGGSGLPAARLDIRVGSSHAFFPSVFSCRSGVRPVPDFPDDFPRSAFFRAQRHYAAQQSVSI